MHPIIVKSYEAAWLSRFARGGHLFAVFKNKGSQNRVASYRDVLIADGLSKTIGRDLRNTIKPFANNITVESQYGSGLNGGAIDIASLHL